MKAERMKLHEEINRLTFELAIDSGSDGSNAPKPFTAKSAKSAKENQKENLANLAGLAVQNALSEAQTQFSNLQSLIFAPQSE